MKPKQIIPLIALLALALFLAFPLQNIIRRVLIEPLIYFMWTIGIVYRSVPQFWVWVILLGVIFFILLSPFLEDRPRWRRKGEKLPPAPGPIENLAETLKASPKGVYFKWEVANRLGKIRFCPWRQSDF
jgi:hypothetical protein